MDFKEIYEMIGEAGVALILVGIAGFYIVIRTMIYLTLVWREFKRDFLDIEKEQGRCFRRYCTDNTNPLICVIRDIVMTHGAHSDDIRAEVAYLFHLHFKNVNNSLTWLKLIASIAPLLGLLGTVLGMVKVFRVIAVNPSPDPTMLASGIWVALITTIMGLAIAIPILGAYYHLMLKFKGFRIEAIEHSYRALELVRGIRKHVHQSELNKSEDHCAPHCSVKEASHA